MSGDGGEFEYPDTAGYPDGMGTLHEGVEDDREDGDEDGSDGSDAREDDRDGPEGDDGDEAATAAEGDVERFALDDEEDVEGV